MHSLPSVHSHKVRLVGDDLLYVNAERLGGDKGKDARTGLFIFYFRYPHAPKQVGIYDMPGKGPNRFGIDHERQLALLPCKSKLFG